MPNSMTFEFLHNDQLVLSYYMDIKSVTCVRLTNLIIYLAKSESYGGTDLKPTIADLEYYRLLKLVN